MAKPYRKGTAWGETFKIMNIIHLHSNSLSKRLQWDEKFIFESLTNLYPKSTGKEPTYKIRIVMFSFESIGYGSTQVVIAFIFKIIWLTSAQNVPLRAGTSKVIGFSFYSSWLESHPIHPQKKVREMKKTWKGFQFQVKHETLSLIHISEPTRPY